jgi:hypothetical protein
LLTAVGPVLVKAGSTAVVAVTSPHMPFAAYRMIDLLYRLGSTLSRRQMRRVMNLRAEAGEAFAYIAPDAQLPRPGVAVPGELS